MNNTKEKMRFYLKPLNQLWIVILFISCIRVSYGQNGIQLDSIEKYLDIGQSELIKENYVQAIESEKRALELAIKINSRSKIAEVQQKLGYTYFQFNDFEQTLKHYLEALGEYERIKNTEKQLELKRLIGDVYIRLEQCDLSFKYFDNILESDLSSLKPSDLSLLYQSVGIAHGRCGSLDSALFYFEIALQKLDKPYKGMVAGGLLNNIGAIYSKRGELEKALGYYKESRSLFERDGSREGIAVSISNHAYILKKQGRLRESAYMFEEALNIFKSTNSLIYLRDNYLNISEVYEALGDYKRALDANNKYLEYNDSISNIEILSKITDLHVQFELKKKDQEVLIAKQKGALAEHESQRTKLLMLFSFLGVVLLGVIVFLIIRNLRISLNNSELSEKLLKQERAELKDEVLSKSSELEDFALRMVERNNLLEELKQEIHEVAVNDKVEEGKLKDIERTISDRLYIEKDRKEFEYNLNQVHQSFLSKLNKKHPDLTKNDTRLCSLLMMELSSKEMAIILNITADSVKKRRHRLRKKLNIEGDIDLKDYFKSL